MKNLLTKIENFAQDEEGASAVEYGLLVALIAAVIIGAVAAVGTSLTGTFNYVAGQIGTAS